MKIEFIKRGAATRLILIFAGWSTDARYYNDCVFDGWDTAVVSDYRDMMMPAIPSQYMTVYIFAYSLGVFAAAASGVDAAVRIAICGTTDPVSDRYGIPVAIFNATASGLSERQLMKFHLRMAGNKAKYEEVRSRLPRNADIDRLRDELYAIAQCQDGDCPAHDYVFDRVYISEEDRIFPYPNVSSYWKRFPSTEIITLKTSHAVDVASIIRAVIPDTLRIGEGFDRAKSTYNDSAVVQAEICSRIGERLASALAERNLIPESVLEIGVGSGLLTEEWRKIMTPRKATYIDLHSMTEFGIADEESYINADAEDWLEKSGERFDVILSASTIQWFVDPVKFIDTVRNHLYPGGIAIISTFVKGNLKELDFLRPSPLIYRSAEEYLLIDAAESVCFERTLEFPSSREMMMHLRQTGVTPKRQISGKDKETGNSAPAMLWSKFPRKLTYRPMILTIINA